MSEAAPLDDAVRIAADYLTDHDMPPRSASPQLALNALADWVTKNPETEVGRWMLSVHRQWVKSMSKETSTLAIAIPPEANKLFNSFREAWQEYIDTSPVVADVEFKDYVE